MRKTKQNAMRGNQYGIHSVLNEGEVYLRLVANSILPLADLKCHCACTCNSFLHCVTQFHVPAYSVRAHKTSLPDPHLMDAGV
jgi:hypothetical protein